jgi:hypothetical protein
LVELNPTEAEVATIALVSAQPGIDPSLVAGELLEFRVLATNLAPTPLIYSWSVDNTEVL